MLEELGDRPCWRPMADAAARLLFRCRLPAACASGTFFAPAAY
jgi:hypothetical protein